MKRAIGLILAVMTLLMSVSLAEDLSALTDDELKALILDAFEELQNRGLSYDPETAVSVLADEAFTYRVAEFYSLWSGNDLDGMLELCDPAWKAEQENPKTSLFAILANRTPLGFTVEAPHDEADGTRTSAVTALMDRHTGKEPEAYRCNILMKKAKDGLWYVDPRCLMTYEKVDGYTQDKPEPEPEENDWSVDETLQFTLLFYVPQGGGYYHLNQNCPRVAEHFLPMKGVFAYQDLNYDEYKDLQPCEVCGAPPRDYAPAELTGFILKIYDESGLGNVSYLRTDIYMDGELLGFICSCPDDGEDFYRFPIDMGIPEQEGSLHIELFYGVSEAAPEDAILSVLTGDPAEEHTLTMLDLAPEAGKTYCMTLEPDGGDGYKLTPAE